MRFNPKYIVAASSFIIVFIAIIIFALSISTVSLPKTLFKGNTELIADTVKVHRNNYGVPFIIANNEQDAYFAMGFVHAQDRLWQMDIMRRTASGSLSEVFGDTTIQTDLLMKAVGIDRISEKLWQNFDSKTKTMLESYSKGVNYYIKTQGTRLPFEFDALNYKPEPWQPVDCVKIQRLLAFKQSLSFWGDLILGKIASDEGVKATSEIISNTYYVLSPTKLGDSSSNHPKISDSLKLATKDTIDYGDSELKKALSLLSKVIDVFTATKSFLSYDGIFGGGNIWAAQSNKLYKSSSVLAADNLTTCVLPAQWYQCRLKCKEFDVSGMTVPGMPVFFFGRNESIAWGMTSFPVDDFDFFIEKISNADTNYYVSKNNLKIKFKYISDTIKTKNSAYPFYLKASGKSVIISDFLVPARVTGSGTIEQDFQPIHSSYCLSFSWTGKETTNEFSVLHDIMFSGDVQRFKNAVKRWRTPAACFVYSDSKGNTGLFPAGYIPIRKSKQNSKFPVSAWKEDSYWEGYELLSSIYEESNPAQGFVHY